MNAEQKEIIDTALKHHSLKEIEREEIAKKTAEFLKHSKIELLPPGKSGVLQSMTRAELNERLYERAKEKEKQKVLGGLQRVTPPGSHIAVDIAGRQFGKLTALHIDKSEKVRKWVCQCECGSLAKVKTHNLLSGLRTECPECAQKTRDKKRSAAAKRLYEATRGSNENRAAT